MHKNTHDSDSSDDIQFAYALHSASGRVYHISKCERDPELICPGCKEPIHPVRPVDKQHHFRHNAKSRCGGGGSGSGGPGESHEHEAAKHILASELSRWAFFGTKCSGCQKPEFKKVCFGKMGDNAVYTTKPEVSCDKYRIDVGVFRDGNLFAAIEVWHKHKTEPEKAKYLRELLGGRFYEVRANEVLERQPNELPALTAINYGYICEPCKVISEAKAKEAAERYRLLEAERQKREEEAARKAAEEKVFRDEQEAREKTEREARWEATKQRWKAEQEEQKAKIRKLQEQAEETRRKTAEAKARSDAENQRSLAEWRERDEMKRRAQEREEQRERERLAKKREVEQERRRVEEEKRQQKRRQDEIECEERRKSYVVGVPDRPLKPCTWHWSGFEYFTRVPRGEQI